MSATIMICCKIEGGLTILEPKRIGLLSCAVFRAALNQLIGSGQLNIPIIYMDSMLHMNPEKLYLKMTDRIEKMWEEYDAILLLYGDCHPFINDDYDEKNVKRVEGCNCFEILLGRELYREMRHKGAFFAMDEWVPRWEEIFIKEMGLTEKNAPIFMREIHSKIVYLELGLKKDLSKDIQNLSQFTGLQVQTLAITTNKLLESIQNALERIS